MRLFIAAAIGAALSVPAGAASLHEFSALALSRQGDQVATVESDAIANSATSPHEHIVIRAASTGRVVSTIDPCASCDYSGLTFAPDGRLVFLQREKGTTRLMSAGAGHPDVLATINGIAQSPLLSPDGREIALLVTIGARKEAGATQAGVRQVGEIGETE